MKMTKWTEDMDNVLRSYYPQYGALYVSIKLGVKWQAVQYRASKLMIRSPKTHYHLLEDCEAMLAEYCREPMSAIAKRRGLTVRQVHACIARAKRKPYDGQPRGGIAHG